MIVFVIPPKKRFISPRLVSLASRAYLVGPYEELLHVLGRERETESSPSSDMPPQGH